MKKGVFARPNLKLFLFAAILVLVVQELFSGNQPKPILVARPWSGAVVSQQAELRQLIEEATKSPSPEIFLRISRCYEQLKDYRRAIWYLRRAERCEASEDL